MTQAPTTHPPCLLRWLAGLARWSLGLLLAAWLFLIVAWALLHGAIVPRVQDWRPQLERYASEALGVAVRVGALSARSEGLLPTLELHDVALLNPQGQVALQLPRVVLALSPRALLQRGFAQLYIERPQLDVERAADGQVFIAGLPFSPGAEGDGAAADWLFSQAEVVVRDGTLRWRDALRPQAPPLALQAVDIVLRNRPWRHALRLDATPPPDWGQRFTLMGQLHEPLLSAHAGAWQRWSGQLYAWFPHVDVAQLHQYVHLQDAALTRGRGALRAWVDLHQGQASGGVADLRLADVDARLGPALAPLALRQLSARLRASRWEQGFELATQDLQFVTADGLNWPGGNLRLRQEHQGSARAQGTLQAEHLDLAALAQIASALPLPEPVHAALRRYTPQGQVPNLQLQWQGELAQWRSYRAQGRVERLALAAPPDAGADWVPQDFGVRGASVSFDANEQGGKAQLALSDGALLLPGVFEEPVLPLQRLSTNVRWTLDGAQIAVQASDLRFANADAQGQAQLRWRTSDPAQAASGTRFPGVLDLQGQLTRADGTRVHRYLPLAIDADVRHYVRDAVQAGESPQVRFKVRGDLQQLPFERPEQGDFYIAAKIRGARYAYVPPRLQTAGEPPWPVLTDLSGELVFDRHGMAVHRASARLLGSAQLQLGSIEAQIPDLRHSVVGVRAQGSGPLADWLAQVQHSPIAAFTGQALAQAQGSGKADLQLQLALPLAALAQSRVNGSLALTGGNELQMAPDIPRLSKLRGSVQFSEQGFSLHGVRAQALGGELRLEGGLRSPEAPVQLRAQGQASAEGLRQAHELGLLAQWAQQASGSTPYQLALTVRRGVPELLVSSSLQGLALQLPAPLNKPAEASWPLRFEKQLTPEAAANSQAPLQERLSLSLGPVLQAQYLRALGAAEPQVLRGSIALGQDSDELPPLPSAGVGARVHLDALDIDAWQRLLQGEAGAATADSAMTDYLPTRLALQAEQLQLQGRSLHALVAGITRDGPIWQASLQARELAGHVQYRQASASEPAGRLQARLARLVLGPSQAANVERLLDAQPAQLPALDIDVQNFELNGRALGRLQVQAQNRGGSEQHPREWRLSQFNLSTPEADFSASGNWAQLAAHTPGAAAAPERRTALTLRLELRDAGALLARLGMPGVLRQGQGHLEGQLAWRGAPISPDYQSMSGQLHLDIGKGQFLKADPGLAKLLGVLSLQSLPRRLTLDFRDVFSQGFAFDFVRGDVQVQQGLARTNNLQMKGVNAAVLMEGEADIARETQNLHVVVVPEINAMTASLVATAINPVIGLGSFLAQALLRGPLMAAATQEFRIEGSWAEPQVVRLQQHNEPAGESP